MVLEAPLYQDGNTYPARLDRQLIEDVFDTEGVLRTLVPGALLVSPRAAGANMSVDVAPGRAVIKGDDEANQGSYRIISTAVENRPIGAAPGSNSRIDLVVARIRDAAVTGGVSSDWVIEVIPGVVAASPVAPAVPNSAIALAQVLVAAGTVSIDAAKITDRRLTASNSTYLRKAGGDTVTASAPGVVPAAVQGAPGQTANLWERRSSSGQVVGRTDPAGREFVSNGFSLGRGLVVDRLQLNTAGIPNTSSQTMTFQGLASVPNFANGLIYRLIVKGRNSNTGMRYVGEFLISIDREGGNATVAVIETRNVLNGVGTGGQAVNIGVGTNQSDGSDLAVNVGNSTGGELQANMSLRVEDGL